MATLTDSIGGYIRLRSFTLANIAADIRDIARGVLDLRSFVSGYCKAQNPISIEVRRSDGSLKALRRTHNLKTTVGIDLIAAVLGGDVVANVTSGTSTATSATTLTNSGATWTTNQFKNHIVYCGTVYMIVLSNTPTALTGDQWTTLGSSTGAAGSTPGATSAYTVALGNAPGAWIALSNDAGAPAAGDTSLASEISTNGCGRAFAAYAHTASTATYTYTKVFTATGAQSIQKAGVFNAQNGGTLVLEGTFTSVPLATSDSATVVWTVTVA